MFRQVADRASPLYGSWLYFVSATGEARCGTANRIGYRPGISLNSSDTDDPRYAMTAQVNYATRTATAMVTDRATNRRFALRDRELANSPCR